MNFNDEMFEIEYDFNRNYGSNLTCSKPNKDRRYIKILLNCRDDYKTIREIYPEIIRPKTFVIHKLWKLGYIQKYGNFEYITSDKSNKIYFEIAPNVWHNRTISNIKKYKKVYYKITDKGEELLKSIGL